MGNLRLRKSLQISLKKTLWPLLPKPWDAPDMEFHLGLWNGVSALYSESGRQLGEENARPLALNHHVAAETIECKYEGSREGRPINMSALRIAMKNFDAASAITAAVRSHHLSQLPSLHALGIWDLYIIARASLALISYQKRRMPQSAATSSVSDALASQYQFISGVFMICRHMTENADPAIMTNQPISADALYSYADDNGIFISFNGMACAGSTKKINEFLGLCVSGARQEADTPCELADIIGEPDNWYQYALAAIELDCFTEYERSLRNSIQSNGGETALRQSAQTYSDLGDYVRALMDDALRTSESGFREGALKRQNVILELLGRPIIKEIPTKHIQARLG